MVWRFCIVMLITLSVTALPARAESDPAATLYGGMKKTAIAMLSSSQRPASLLVDHDADGAPEPVDLFSCGDEMTDVGVAKGDSFNAAIATAIWGVRLTNLLKDAGLSGIADEGIETIERDEIEDVRAELQKATYDREAAIGRRRIALTVMAARLNQAVLARGLSGFGSPAFVVKGDCSAAETAYRLAPSDTHAQLHIIKEFYYLTCQTLGINVSDRQHCLGWQSGGSDLFGASQYRYVADLPDGRQLSDSYVVTDATIDSLGQNGDGAPKVLVVPITPP